MALPLFHLKEGERMANNILNDLKALRKVPLTKSVLVEYITDVMENFFYSMFDYKNFPDSMPKEYAERYLIWCGCAAAGKVPEKYNKGLYKGEAVFLHAQSAEDPDVYGLGSKCIVTSANGYNEVKSFDEVAFGWNNSAHTDLKGFIMSAAQAIANALVTVRSDIRYAKNHPIYKAKDDKEAAALNEYWKKVKDSDGDDDLAIASYNIMDDLIEGKASGAASNVINLSDPLTSDKLQYITKVVDDYMRWCFGLYGQTIQGNGKLAQQSVDEVNGQTSTSFILPNDMLYQRRLWLDRMKAQGLVGEDAEIDFSEAWKVEEIKYQNEAEAEVEQDGEPETEPEEEPETQPEGEPEEKEDKENE